MSKLKKTEKMDSGITVIPGFDPSNNGEIVAVSVPMVFASEHDIEWSRRGGHTFELFAGTIEEPDYRRACRKMRRFMGSLLTDAGAVIMYKVGSLDAGWRFLAGGRLYSNSVPHVGSKIVGPAEYWRVVSGLDAIYINLDDTWRRAWKEQQLR